MQVFQFFKEHIIKIAQNEYSILIDSKNITLEYPKNKKNGDLSTNIAIIIGKKIGGNIVEIARNLAKKIQLNEFIKSAEFAPNGFVNLNLHQEFWSVFLHELLNQGADYPKFDLKKYKKINVEFVSANPTGPLHIGHAKGAVIGDVIANILVKYGFDVTKEYYINDAGIQIDKLARSLDIRLRQQQGERIELPDNCYPGDYLITIADKISQFYKDELSSYSEENKLLFLKKFAVDEIIKLIKADLKILSVEHDVFVSEKKIMQTDNLRNMIDILTAKNLVYKGVLEKPKGQNNPDWEAKEQLIFKSSQFGDDSDRPIIKHDGDSTYFATDIVYHYDKIKRGFQQMILFLGADHIGYEKRIKSVVKALSNDQSSLEVKICQLVKLKKNGKLIKMSKRSGNFITLDELLRDVGPDALKFEILQKSADTVIEFDIDKLKQQNKNNPVFYVQYASARTHSIMRKFTEDSIADDVKDLDYEFNLLTAEHEINMIKHLALYPKIIESCVKTLDPHKISYYLYDLACLFHQSWNMGNVENSFKFIIQDNPSLTKARLGLVRAVSLVLASGLKLLGIKSLQKM